MVQVSENLRVRDGKSAKNILPHSSLSQQTSKVLKENLPNYNNTMEFPPSNWDIFPVEEFTTAAPRVNSDCSVELMAIVRPNGRVMDHWRLATGGTKLLSITLELASIIPAAAALPKCKITYQQWPADLAIRRNMTTSPWLDVMTLLAANELTAADEQDEVVESQTIMENLRALPNKSVISAAVRWAVCISEDQHLEIQLQCLPAPVTTLNSKPIFKR